MRAKLFLCVAVLITINSGCKKNDLLVETEYPIVTTAIEDIDSDGVVFVGKFLSRGNEEIIEFGFQWRHFMTSELSKIIIDTVSNVFKYHLTNNLKEDDYYIVQSYVITDNFTAYGSQCLFSSNGSTDDVPHIDSIAPTEVEYGDLITLYGRNFGYERHKTVIRLGDHRCNIESIISTKIVFETPYTTAGEKSGLLKVNGYEIPFGPITYFRN